MSLAIDAPALPSYRAPFLAALATALGFLACVAGWAMFARLDAAIVTVATLHADSERKSVEHLEGGILAELLVRAGDRVEAGDVVARLDATQTRELLAQLGNEAEAARFAIWRLEAEASGATPELAAAPAADEARARAELALFEARHAAHAAARAALQQQIAQLRAEIAASDGRGRSAGRRLALWEEERGQTAALAERGAAPRQRLLEFDRAVAEAEGERDEQARLAEAAGEQIRQAESQIRALEAQREAEIRGQLVEARKTLTGLESRIRAAEDVRARLELRAPQAGRVVEISTVTPGAVVGAGEPLLTILPEDDQLVALAKLPPAAIDNVTLGGPARVRLSAYRRADAPTVPGEVSYVSADLLENPADGSPYYEVRVALDTAAVGALKDVMLVAGMPVELSLTLGERRAGDYLLEPLLRHVRRAFREE